MKNFKHLTGVHFWSRYLVSLSTARISFHLKVTNVVKTKPSHLTSHHSPVQTGLVFRVEVCELLHTSPSYITQQKTNPVPTLLMIKASKIIQLNTHPHKIYIFKHFIKRHVQERKWHLTHSNLCVRFFFLDKLLVNVSSLILCNSSYKSYHI